jgi:MraZ protein
VFRGVNNINLDAKGRMAIPTRYRDSLGRHCDGHVIVTVSPAERCLWIYPLPDWEDVERKLVALPTLNARAQRLKRMLIGHATDCDMDGSGRVLLSGPLREFSGLEKKVVLIGQGNKFEVWNEEVWNTSRDSWLSDDAETGPLSPDLETLSL